MLFKKGKIERVLVLAILALMISLGAPGVNYAASDVTPPTLNELTVSKQEATVGDEVKITADVSDDLSGVESVTVKYKAPIGTANKYMNLRLNPETGKYESSFEIEEYDASGNWGIDYILMIDKQDNSYSYHHSETGPYQGENSERKDLSQYDVKVSGTKEDNSPPTLKNLNVTPRDVTKGDIVNVEADVSDDLSGVRSVTVKYKAPIGTANKYMNLSLNTETGKYESSFEIGEYDASGNWGIDYILMIDKQDNSYSYHHSETGPYQGENSERKDLSQYDVKVSGTKEDNSPPTLNQLNVNPRDVTNGGRVNVEADVSDDLSGVKSVTVKYKAPIGTANKYMNLSLNTETGKYESSFEIGEYDASGNWGIDYILMIDKQDNSYSYHHSETGPYQGENSERKDLSQYDVVVEKIAPKTKLDMTSSTPMKNGWYPSNVTATLSATDEESGIKKVEYRINEGTWNEYKEAFEISQEGEVQLDYRSVDHAGNVEEVQTEIIKIDKTSPVTTTSDIPTKWGNEEIELTLKAQDESSGVSSIEYKLNDGDWTAYDTHITISEEGKHVIEYRSTDQAGNQEEVRTVNVNHDFKAPETSISSVSDEWHDSNVEVTLSSSDGLSGVSKTEYRVNEEEWVNYDTSILLEEEGSNKVEFRSIDHAGNVEATQSKVIKVDKTAPVTTAEEVPADWSNQDIELTLSSSDELSGVSSMEYKINEGEWKVYSDPITLDQEGSTTIEYRSIDKAGNEEEIQSVVVKLDQTSPVTTASETPIDWVSEEVELTLTAKDELSDVSSVEYKINGSDWKLYNGTITLKQEGENVIEYRSVDVAGNQEEKKSLTVKLDLTTPETSISDVSDQWQTSSVEVALSATDSLTGVSKTEYRVNDGEWTAYSRPVVFEKEGAHKLEYRSFDEAGNVEEIQSETIKIDTTAPVISVNGVPEKWAHKATEITLTAKDQLSGVAAIEYRMNEGEWTDYRGPITFQQQGENVIDYRSVDTAGNVEEFKSITVKYDNNAPQTSAGNVGDQWHNSEVEVTLSSTDTLSGVAKTEYRINEGEWKEYTTPVLIDEEGGHTVDYRSIDYAGNEEEVKSINVKLDSTAPDTAMSTEKRDNDVELTLSSSDALSGVSKTEYRINHGEWLEYNSTVIVSEEGTHTVDYRSIDHAGNVETIQSTEVTIDKPSNDVTFKDIQGHWAEDKINYLVENNLLSGYKDGTFQPDVNITRAEAATVISRELELEKIGSDFTDVSEDHWASGYIGAAAKANILSGYKDGTFHPNENLSRAEMATIVSRAYQLQGQTNIFSDTKGHWADSYIQTLAANNITVGYPDGTFKPEQEITRAEFASFVARVLEDSFRVTD